MTSPLHSNRGFGLISVLLLITVLAIGASIALLDKQSVERTNAPVETTQRMDKLKAAILLYKTNLGTNPTTLDALLTAPSGAQACRADTTPASPTFRQLIGWCGPYLENEFSSTDLYKRDGWKTLLQYNGTTLTSCGPNRLCGDGDDITITP